MKSDAPVSDSGAAKNSDLQSSDAIRSRLTSATIWSSTIWSSGMLLLLAFAGQYSGAYSEDLMSADIRLPFVWRDVALVCLLSAVPICIITVPMIVGRLKPLFSGLLAASLWFIFWTAFDCSLDPNTIAKNASGFPFLDRVGASLSICMPMIIVGYLAVDFIIGRSNRRVEVNSSKIFLRAIAGLIVLTLVPGLYSHARSHDDLRQFGSLRQQSRYGEARWLLARVQAMAPSLRIDGRPLHREQREITGIVEDLQLQTGNPIPASAEISVYIQRGRELAMLGRAEQAKTLLLQHAETLQNADACSLLGMIYENRRDWNSALRYYAMADRISDSSSQTAQSQLTQDAAQAYQVAMGTAYCYRQLGQLSEAKSSYQKLLSLDSNAGTHFLLAQFFEDIQETENALQHAEAARRIDPNRYGEKAAQLIDNMQSKHFGCFRILRSSR